jgi:hypothetical protein
MTGIAGIVAQELITGQEFFLLYLRDKRDAKLIQSRLCDTFSILLQQQSSAYMNCE